MATASCKPRPPNDAIASFRDRDDDDGKYECVCVLSESSQSRQQDVCLLVQLWGGKVRMS